MNLALMQPTFIPWIGYFDLIDYVDEFIFFDTVQLAQQSWQTRNKIKVHNRELLISVPIQKSLSNNLLLIHKAKLDFRKFDFRKKLFKTLQQNYIKAPYFQEVHPFITDIIMFKTDSLAQYNINIIQKIALALKISTKFTILSQTDYIPTLHKGEQVLDICTYFGTDEYVSPLGSKEYLESVHSLFEEKSIRLSYQYYMHPKYRQLGTDFIPYMGIFDLLYNAGFENSLQIIRQGRDYENREV